MKFTVDAAPEGSAFFRFTKQKLYHIRIGLTDSGAFPNDDVKNVLSWLMLAGRKYSPTEYKSGQWYHINNSAHFYMSEELSVKFKLKFG